MGAFDNLRITLKQVDRKLKTVGERTFFRYLLRNIEKRLPDPENHTIWISEGEMRMVMLCIFQREDFLSCESKKVCALMNDDVQFREVVWGIEYKKTDRDCFTSAWLFCGTETYYDWDEDVRWIGISFNRDIDWNSLIADWREEQEHTLKRKTKRYEIPLEDFLLGRIDNVKEVVV